MKKKILSFLITLCIVTALLPTNVVFAATTSGTFGNNLTWNLDSSGTLTISGTGDMTSWTSSISVPWYSSRNSIETIVIGGNVTSIGSYAFYYCSNLTSVTIGNSVTSIGRDAFHYCENLTSVKIPDGVTNIGMLAFAGCGNLKEITLPSSVESIDDYAFQGCWNLETLHIADLKAYLTCEYESWDSNPMGHAKKLRINGNEITDVTIPEGVTKIPSYAFAYCTGITEIKIPESVKTIGQFAFSNCTNLAEITIANSVTSIQTGVFYKCSSLKEITIPNDVTSINDSVFYECSQLTNITLPDSYTSIGGAAFYSCYSLKEITIPHSVTQIYYSAFENCGVKTVYYNGTENDWNNIGISDKNDRLTKATRTYFAYINIFDKDGNKVIDTTQNMGEYVNTSSITVPDGYAIKLYKDKEMTIPYSLDTPISENLNLYYDIIEVNRLKITGAESADIGQKGITESVTFATDKTAKDFVATIKYSDKLNFVKANSEIFDIEADEYTDDGQKYLSLTCTYKNDGNMPKNTTLNAFDLVFDVSESATANEKLTIEFVGGETFLADGGTNAYDFDGLGTAEIKVNSILVKSVTINGTDEIDKATQYTAVISPENATNKGIEWSVDNSEIATISADGILTPIKAGTVKIKATAKGGNNVYAEKSVNVKVYAQITSLTASAGEWNKEFTPAEREYIICVPENTSLIKFTAQHSGTLKSETKTFYNGRTQTISLTDTETVLTLNYSELGYTDSEYKIKIVKFEGTKTTVSEDGKTFTIKPINIANGNTIILALYNGEEFVTMQSAVCSGKDIPFTVTDDYTTAKVMVWNNLDDITPICDVEIVK